jgi:hypothetical protein
MKAAVDDNPAEALAWVVRPAVLVADLAMLEMVDSEHSVEIVPEISGDEPPHPRFDRLLRPCSCKSATCDRCAVFQLTPRTAAALWFIAQTLGDEAYDDVEQGDQPIDDRLWNVLHRYPLVTWQQDTRWRRKVARAFDDLADDLAEGRWPIPRCPGEEMALHLMLEDAPEAIADRWCPTELLERLPAHGDDFDWDRCREIWSRTSVLAYVGPHAWFTPFENVSPRAGDRAFRR